MQADHLTKNEWVDLFGAIGLDEPTMRRWHGLFETRSPDAHQGFLEWLRVPSDEIARIRDGAREWAGKP